MLYGQKLAAPALMWIRLNIVSPHMKRTAGKLLGLLVVVFATSGTSCSCYEVRLSDQEAANVGRLIGTSIQAKKDLIGMLGEHIDDNHKFVHIQKLPGYKNRFVLKRIPIPAGTRFRIVGLTRPRNVLCSGIDAVLLPTASLDPSGAEAEIDLVETSDGHYTVDPEMFVEVPEANSGG